jgi:ATP-dependent Lon protease
LQIIELKNQIQNKVKIDLDKQQRDYLLNQQLKTIQEELGDNPHTQDIAELKQRAAKKKWPVNVAETFDKGVVKTAENESCCYGIFHAINYLDVMILTYHGTNILLIILTSKEHRKFLIKITLDLKQ